MSFFKQEQIDNESKEKKTKNQHYFHDFINCLKRFCLPTILLRTRIIQNNAKKNKSNENFANLKNHLCRNQYQFTSTGMF